MSMIAKITEPVTPLGSTAPSRPLRATSPVKHPRRVPSRHPSTFTAQASLVVPDKAGAILEACGEAGGKGGSKLLWTLGLLPLMAV